MPKSHTTEPSSREHALRMLAIQIVQQLPSDLREAESVLEHARKLLKEYLHEERGEPQRPHLRSVS